MRKRDCSYSQWKPSKRCQFPLTLNCVSSYWQLLWKFIKLFHTIRKKQQSCTKCDQQWLDNLALCDAWPPDLYQWSQAKENNTHMTQLSPHKSLALLHLPPCCLLALHWPVTTNKVTAQTSELANQKTKVFIQTETYSGGDDWPRCLTLQLRRLL